MKNRTDIQVLGSRIKNRDIKAFHLLYAECFCKLRNFAYRYVCDMQEAENITQNAFLQLWTVAPNFDEKRNPYSYLIGIVRNSCFNFLRQLKIEANNSYKLMESILFAQMEDNTLEPKVLQQLNKALAMLPRRQLEIMLLHVVEQKTISEIVEELNLSQNTIKTHLKRALSLMRQYVSLD